MVCVLMPSQKPLWSRQGNNPSKFKLWISKLFQDPSGQLVRAPDAYEHSSPTNVSNFTSPHPSPPGGGCQSIYLLPRVDPCLLEGIYTIPFELGTVSERTGYTNVGDPHNTFNYELRTWVSRIESHLAYTMLENLDCRPNYTPTPKVTKGKKTLPSEL